MQTLNVENLGLFVSTFHHDFPVMTTRFIDVMCQSKKGVAGSKYSCADSHEKKAKVVTMYRDL